MTLQLEHERVLHAMAAKRSLPVGQSYMIDAETGLVSSAMVWLHGDVWYVDHFDRAHPDYRREYGYAVHRPSTLWRPRS